MIKNKKIKKYYPWIVVGILWVVSMLNYLDRLLIASMREPIKESIPMTEANFGLLTSVFLFVYGILTPFGGFIADRYGRKTIIVISLFVWSVFTLWTGFVNSFGEMIIARALMGISEACYMPASVALITDYHRGGTRSFASGLLISGLYAGMALGGAGGYIADFWGWRFAFHLFGGIGILYAIFMVFVLRDAPVGQSIEKGTSNVMAEKKEDSGIKIRDLLENLFFSRSYWILIIYNCLLGMTFWIIYTWLPTYFREQFNLSPGDAGISSTVFVQTASFVGVLVGGFWADRWSRQKIKGRLYVPVIGFTVGGPFLFLMASTGTFGIAIAGIIVFGLAKGFHDSNHMPIICQVIDERYRATGYGILGFFSIVAGGIMVYVGGVIRDANISLSIIFMISAVGVLISGLILLIIRPKTE
jgi:MFS transporter, Spinster family, sphingosine-1-phosphate transporter